ncbi:MAG: ribokinase [Treponema sp.]|jgi:ribokinase|nr:ribokinase [Treponema sp.]
MSSVILVAGSINIDLTVTADEIPLVGETVIGKSFNQYPGGKGANQAVAAAKLKAGVCFLGKVGEDAYGDFMLREMASGGVDVSHIERCETSTGIASISVDSKGQNNIIVVPGANFRLDFSYIDRHKDAIENCDIILSQHEIPMEITEYVFKIAKSFNKTTILNPSPAQKISEVMVGLTDILVPNEFELSRMTGLECKTSQDIVKASRMLQSQGIKTIIVTMGKEGVMYFGGEDERSFPAFKVDPVDTTAAGDSFLGGFAASYAKNSDIAAAIEYGQMVASYSIQRKGAQSSMPSYEEFEAYQKTITK